MMHQFDIDIATQYGVAEAIILNNLWFWVKKNEANGANFFDGEYWTYNSIKAFEQLFPYLSTRNIRTVLKHLIDADLIKTGNYNKSEYDRTLWYAFTAKGKVVMDKCICQNEQMDLSVVTNGSAQTDKPIPDNKTHIINTDNKTHISAHDCAGERKPSPKEIEKEFDELWKLYPRKAGRKPAFEKYKRVRRDGSATFEEVKAGIEAYANFVKGKDEQYIAHGSTFFNQERWQDDWTVKSNPQDTNNPFLDMWLRGDY